MGTIVLVGDSILDNGAYVRPGGDVLAKLQARLPGDGVKLLARDGATIAGARRQLVQLPDGATNLIVSAGGNDALQSTGVLAQPAASVSEALAKVLAVRNEFAAGYKALLGDVEATGLPAAICTIYDVRLPDERRDIANLALGLLNDVITREAASRRLPLIDLRVMFTSEHHFANSIEPSELGSDLIAAAITQAIEHDYSGRSSIYTGFDHISGN